MHPSLADVSSDVPPKSPLRVACSNCGLRELCLPVGVSGALSDAELGRLDTLVGARRTVRRGEALFRRADPFVALYAVRTGFFKTCATTEHGREQVTGFQMAGELLGLDGIDDDRHRCDAIALEDSQVCVIAYDRLEHLSREFIGLQRQFHRVMAREIVREHGVMMLLGCMRAEERVAAFLSNLVLRLQARGFSPSALVLRMSREEIGTYLGLTLETVSRCFSKFNEEKILEVRQRQVRILDPAALRRIVVGSGD